MTSSISLSFFNFASASTTTGIGADLLSAWATSKVQAAQSVIADAQKDPDAPTAPWEIGYPMPEDEALAQSALNGGKFFDIAAAQYAGENPSGDYARLFAVHSGLKTMSALAAMLEDEKLNSVQRARIEKTFARGRDELQAFMESQKFDSIRLALGDRVDEMASKLGLEVKSEDYVTADIHRGSLTDSISGLDPNAQFDIAVTTLNGATQTVAIDLSQMGSQTRSLGAIVSFINQRLTLAGVQTRFKAEKTSPDTTEVKVGDLTFTRPFTGLKTYALRVDVKAGEKVAFEAPAARDGFYVVGQTPSGARLIKLEDVFGANGEPTRLSRPGVTNAASNAASGYVGAGAPYVATPSGSWSQKTNVLVSHAGDTAVEGILAKAGEAVLELAFSDGRKLAVTTAWRAEDVEQWRVRDGESEDLGRLDDLAERLTQLLHEQGIAVGVDVWTDVDGGAGFDIRTADGITASKLNIGGRTISLSAGDPPIGGLDGGLRAGIFARRFEALTTQTPAALFEGEQTFTFGRAAGNVVITIDGGENGISAADLVTQLNEQLQLKGVAARAAMVDQGGVLALQIDTLHETTSLSVKLNDQSISGILQAPGAWANGGLPGATAGQPFGDARRTLSAANGAPLSAPGNDGALDIDITIATPTGDKVVSLAITALERAADPDIAPGQWSGALQARLDEALNAAGIYASSESLSAFTIAEGSGQRLKSVVINGQTIDYAGAAQSIGGAFDTLRSFESNSVATQTTDVLASLTNDPSISITLRTIWGDKTISASLEPGDPRTLESAALRLNEALAAAGYDAGVEAANLAGGAGLRFVTGSSFTISQIAELEIGGGAVATTLDPIDAISHADDPPGVPSVAERAARGAAAILTAPLSGAAPYTAPTINATGWFAGRAFDVSLGDGSKILAARESAVASDGSIYVLADIANLAGDQPVKGVNDVALIKYDSAGNIVFTRTLGAAEKAEGFSLAVSTDGRVAIAGAVTGALGPNAQGGADSFVTMFAANGAELWTQRRGAKADDYITALAFGADGTLFVGGQTKSALGAQLANGGVDSYLRAYSTSGLELFTRQFGTSGDDSVGAIALREAGGGVVEITTGGVENGRGVLRQFTYSATAGLAASATRDIGAFRNGAKIASLAIDNGAIYVGGVVEADKLDLSSIAREAVAGLEGFVARVSTNLGSTALDRTTYLGSSQDDSVAEVAIVGGVVYAAGSAAGIVAGNAKKGSTDGFLARLDADGDIAWLRNFNTTGGKLNVTSLNAAPASLSALDRLGLPAGMLAAADSTRLIDRSTLRAGDEFAVTVNDGLARRIAINAKDTLSAVATRIDALLGAAGSAAIEKKDGVERIVITARRGDAISLVSGPEGKDALTALGLSSGIIAIKPTPDSPAKRGEIRTFGLGVQPNDLKLTDAAAIKRTKAEISAALSILRQAYAGLADPASLDKTQEELDREDRLAGAVPEYLNTQLQNYAMGLLKLSGA